MEANNTATIRVALEINVVHPGEVSGVVGQGIAAKDSSI
jgi:hypothetical protein